MCQSLLPVERVTGRSDLFHFQCRLHSMVLPMHKVNKEAKSGILLSQFQVAGLEFDVVYARDNSF